MRKRLKEIYDHSTLVAKIRYSYLCLLVPFVLFLIFCFYNLWNNNRRYEDMVNSSVMASQFSLDFQKDFDYETYLLIVGNKTLEESSLHAMLEEADEIVAGLEELTESQENRKRLTSVKKYLNNLGTYIGRIEDNIREGNRYEDNIEIWENDVQIVTSLVGDTMSRYIYYEIRGIQESRQQYQDFFVNMIRFSVIAFALILMLCLFLSYYIPLSITRPIRRLTQVTDQVAKGDLTVRSDVTGGLEARVLSDSMNTMIDKINELLEQVKTEQVRLRKAEFELLQSQINPHFLYNTLDSIIWMAEGRKYEEVVLMTASLARLLRQSISNEDEVVPLAREVEYAKGYLTIQKMRYKDKLEFEIDVEPSILNIPLIKLVLQPIIENAIYHGLKYKESKGLLQVKGFMKDGNAVLQVIDNGVGMDEETLSHIYDKHKVNYHSNGVGVYNVQKRLKLYYGENYGITYESEKGVGTTATITIPGIQEESI